MLKARQGVLPYCCRTATKLSTYWRNG